MSQKHSLRIMGLITGAILALALAAVAYLGGQLIQSRYAAAAEKPDAHAGEAAAVDAHGHAVPPVPDAHGAAAAEAEGAHADEVTLTADALKQSSVTVEAARKQLLHELFAVPGRISYNSEAMAHVGTPVEGRVVEIPVRLGEQVQPGDVLFVIDSPVLGEAQSDFLQKRTQVQVAQSAQELAQTASDRARRLLEGKGISLSEYQKREGEYKTAQGALLAAQAALTAAENKLHLWGMVQTDVAQLIQTGEIRPRYSVRAPLAGCIIEREATLGEIVGPSRDALLVLADLKTLWVLADVPETVINQVALGSRATVLVDALKDRRFVGKVTYVAPALDKATRTAQVRIEVEDGHSALRPGMFAQVQLTLNSATGRAKEPVIAVPEAAVQIVEGGPAVFVEVAGEPNTFAKQAVAVGPAVGQLVPVLSGLDEGKRYVSGGAFLLKAELAKGIMEGKTCSGH